ILKLFELLGQYGSLSSVTLGESATNQPVGKAAEWLEALAQLPASAKRSYLGRRLCEALESVQQRGSADALVEDLKDLSDLDAGRAQDSYALVRIVIWATPMLGFLGTVIGITDALGDLGRELSVPATADGANALETAIPNLLSGLYVAFDTTAIALCFSIGLMFIQFMLDRSETQLLAAVDERASRELAGRFELTGSQADPNVQAIQRMGQAVLRSTEQLVSKQTDLWQQSISAAHEQWQRTSKHTAEQLQVALAAALSQALTQHAAQIGKIEQTSSEQLAQRWEQWQMSLSHNARLLHAQQQEMVKQGEMMTQAMRAAGEVMQLEKALNQNLAALSGAKNFEDTVMSLAAAIQLLSTRLGQPVATPHVELRAPQVKGRAA
ncbi:MAG TPA: MotA/TolQ/ExbB proton channel family protein, partial [Pirellulaceae bacterium]|nr:MotA/TolQ/ExbB proton channel family protein [Pirellulaceae bacterium]